MNNACVITATDRQYVVATEVMLRSLDANYHGAEKLDIYILVPERLLSWEFTGTEFKNITINLVYPEMAGLPEWKEIADLLYSDNLRLTPASMYRFFMAECVTDYNKAVYIDPDTVVMRDIQPLLDFPLANPVGAMGEMHLEFPTNPEFKDAALFNSGVMVVDLKAWRILKVLKNIMKATKEFKAYTTGSTDQDVLNVVFKNNWTPLPSTFNYLVNVYPDMDIKDPLVVHWAGRRKPWSNAANNKWRDTWKYYRQISPTTTS